MTRLLSLRKEEPPEGEAVVVRGGEMHRDVIRRAAIRAFEETGMHAISVFIAFDDNVPGLCQSVSDLSRYGSIRMSTAEALRSGGFALLPTGRRPHFTVVLPDAEDATLGRLDTCFGPAVPNPGR